MIKDYQHSAQMHSMTYIDLQSIQWLGMSVASWCCTCFCVVLCVSFCTGRFVMVPLNLTYLNCLQHSFYEHLFTLYWHYIITSFSYLPVCFLKSWNGCQLLFEAWFSLDLTGSILCVLRFTFVLLRNYRKHWNVFLI